MKNRSMLSTAATALLVAGAGLLASCGERPPITTIQNGFRGTGMELNYNPRLVQQVAAANQPPSVLYPAADSSGPRASEVYQNVQVLKDLSVGEFTRVMLAITAWVAPPEQSCNYCHGANMADDNLYTKVVARRMLEMTRHVNTAWKSHVKETGVTCYTCHHGQPVPQYKWFTDPGPGHQGGLVATRAEQNVPSPAIGLATLPYDPFTPFLLKDYPIRVQGLAPLPNGNVRSIKETEWTYSLMIHMSRSLGVNCTYCHNSRSWQTWYAPPQRATAWYGIRMARDLNNNYIVPLTKVFPANRLGPLGDAAKVNCATCHRGVYKPLFGVSIAKDYPELSVRNGLIPASLMLGPPGPAQPGDADGDGVADAKDACPDTPAGTRVGPMGCSCDLNVQLTFATDSADLTADDVRILEYATGVLRKLSWTSGVIEGHTDATGSDEINGPLSERRAETVRQFLLARGVGDDRMRTAGFGSSRPIGDNATAEGRAQNRRVVLRRTDCGDAAGARVAAAAGPN